MSFLTVYRASAGSGKTFTLAAEYVAKVLCQEGADPSATLAVTFTNKATTEMKQRIVSEMWNLAQGSPSPFRDVVKALLRRDGVIDDDGPAAEQLITRRAAQALHNILHRYDDFHVLTIDTFFHGLLTALAHELGLSAGCGVEIDDEQVSAQAASRLIDLLPERTDLQTWVMEYVKQRIADGERWDILSEVRRLARCITSEPFMLHEEQLLPVLEDSEAMQAYIADLRKKRAIAASRLVESARSTHQAVLDSGGYEQYTYGKYVRSYLDRLIKGDTQAPSTTLRTKHMAAPDGWLRKKEAQDPILLAKATALYRQLVETESVRQAEAFTIHSCSLSLGLFGPLRLIGEIGRLAAGINQENNRFMLAKTPLLFHRMVGQDDAPFVLERAGIRFQNILMDEFQDTSPLQWANFARLIRECIAKGGDGLIVGDVKQGIYRFRGGDWKLLENIGAFMPAQTRIDDTTLTANYRSRREIVCFNNALFRSAARLLNTTLCPALPDGSMGQSLYYDVEQTPKRGAGGHVEVHFIPPAAKNKDNNEKDEPQTLIASAPQMAPLMQQYHAQGRPWSDMAVLVRFTKEARNVLKDLSLIAPEIPIVSDEAFALSSSSAVLIVINVLRWIASPADDTARLFATRAWRMAYGSTDCMTVIPDDADNVPVDLQNFLDQTAHTGLYETCERIVLHFRLHRMMGETPYLTAFLDEVMAAVESGYASPASFLNEWDTKICNHNIPNAPSTGVRITTIHKSKGLDFPIVFLPACNWPMEKDFADDFLWCVPEAAPYDKIPPLPVSTRREMAQSVYAADYSAEHRDSRIENLNMLYVAFTRAAEAMYAWAEVDERKAASPDDPDVPYPTVAYLLYDCLNGQDYISPDASTPADSAVSPVASSSSTPVVKKTTAQSKANPFAYVSEPIPTAMESVAPRAIFRQSNAAAQYVRTLQQEESAGSSAHDGANRDAPPAARRWSYLDRGKVMHRLFSMLQTADDLPAAIRQMEAEGLWSSEAEPRALEQELRSALSQQPANQWFDGSWQVQNEGDLLCRLPSGQIKTLRPDRVMTKANRMVVVDYKFGVQRPEHHEQVAQYLHYLRLTCPTETFVEGFLWYVDNGAIVPVVTE